MSGSPSSAYLSPVTSCRPAVAVRAEPDRSRRVSSEPAPLSLRLPRSAPWNASDHRRDWAQRKTATAPARFDGQVRRGWRWEEETLSFDSFGTGLVHGSGYPLNPPLYLESDILDDLQLLQYPPTDAPSEVGLISLWQSSRADPGLCSALYHSVLFKIRLKLHKRT